MVGFNGFCCWMAGALWAWHGPGRRGGRRAGACVVGVCRVGGRCVGGGEASVYTRVCVCVCVCVARGVVHIASWTACPSLPSFPRHGHSCASAHPHAHPHAHAHAHAHAPPAFVLLTVFPAARRLKCAPSTPCRMRVVTRLPADDDHLPIRKSLTPCLPLCSGWCVRLPLCHVCSRRSVRMSSGC